MNDLECWSFPRLRSNFRTRTDPPRPASYVRLGLGPQEHRGDEPALHGGVKQIGRGRGRREHVKIGERYGCLNLDLVGNIEGRAAADQTALHFIAWISRLPIVIP